MKDVPRMGSGGIVPRILKLSALHEGEWSASHAGTNLDRRLGGPLSRSGYDDKKNNPCFCQESNHGRTD